MWNAAARIVEKITGWSRASREQLAGSIWERKAHAFRFRGGACSGAFRLSSTLEARAHITSQDRDVVILPAGTGNINVFGQVETSW